MDRGQKLVTSNQTAIPEWLAAVRETALTFGAWWRIELDRQLRTLSDCSKVAAAVWADAGPAANDGAWWAPVQLWQKEAELVLRRGAEWSTHLTEMQIQWAELQHEQWMASIRPWLASASPGKPQRTGLVPPRR